MARGCAMSLAGRRGDAASVNTEGARRVGGRVRAEGTLPASEQDAGERYVASAIVAADPPRMIDRSAESALRTIGFGYSSPSPEDIDEPHAARRRSFPAQLPENR